MHRIPEPELMTDDAQARAYAEADFEAPHHQVIVHLCQNLPNLPETGRALDIGCGPADITIRFAKTFPKWHIDSIDGSAAMLRYGRAAIVEAGVASQIDLLHAYLPGSMDLKPQYDLIFSNGFLHHLRDPNVLWDTIHRWSRPDTAVFVTDLRRPRSSALAKAMVQRYSPNEPPVLQRDFYNSLLAAYRVHEVTAQLKKNHLGHFQIRASGDRHLHIWGIYGDCENTKQPALVNAHVHGQGPTI